MGKDRKELIRKHASDMLGIERHILQAIKRQLDSEYVRDHAQASSVIGKMETTIERHINHLEEIVDEEDSNLQATAKKAVTGAMGIIAGLYDRTRQEKLSRILRDNNTALGLATMSYTAMHAFGLTIDDQRIADLAKKHLEDLAPLQMEFSRILPIVVVEETADELDITTDKDIREKAVKNTQDAWRQSAPETASATTV